MLQTEREAFRDCNSQFISFIDQTQCELLNYCSVNPCENGGQCVPQYAGYVCACLPGYGGSTCQFDVDDCASHPCKNGGQCLDQVNGYRCNCTLPGTGGRIQIKSCLFIDSINCL